MGNGGMVIGGAAASKITDKLTEKIDELEKEKKNYLCKLETANGDDIFKYILLINISALDEYITLTRLQAEQSFLISKNVALGGCVVMILAIILSICITVGGNTNLNAGYLSGIAGIVTESIAGVFLYIYNKTLQQLNLFHDKLILMQQTSMSYMATSLVSDINKRDQVIMDLANKMRSSV